MSWLAILFWVISNAPDLIALIRLVLGLIGKFPKNKAQQVKFDVEDAIKHKDKHRLKDILEKAKNDSDSAVPSGASIKRDTV